MRKKMYVMVLVLISISMISVAQEEFSSGFLIEKGGNKVKGYINKYNLDVCEYKYELNSVLQKFSANEIDGFSINDGKYLKSKILRFNDTERAVFMECLIEGVSSIYMFEDRFFIEKGDRFAELTNDEKIVKNEDGKKFVKRTSRYKGTILYLFGDYPNINKEVENLEFNAEAFVNLARKYNIQLPDESVYETYTDDVSSKIEIAPTLGFVYQKYKIDNSWSAMDLEQDYSALVGIVFNLKTPKVNDKVRIQVAFTGFQKQLKGSYSKMKEAEYLYEANFKANYLNVRFGVKYLFLESNFKPYIGVGFDYFLRLSYSGDLDVTRISYFDGSEQKITEDAELLGSFMGIGGNIGFEYSLSQKSNLFLNIAYSAARYKGSDKNISNEYYVQTIYTNIGYYFSL